LESSESSFQPALKKRRGRKKTGVRRVSITVDSHERRGKKMGNGGLYVRSVSINFSSIHPQRREKEEQEGNIIVFKGEKKKRR